MRDSEGRRHKQLVKGHDDLRPELDSKRLQMGDRPKVACACVTNITHTIYSSNYINITSYTLFICSQSCV